MISRVFYLTALAVGSPWATGEDLAPPQPMSADAAILITINPEARVSVRLTGKLPAPVTCGTAGEFLLKVINQGFVATALEAELVEPAPEGTSLEFAALPLTGTPEEWRTLRLILTRSGATDLTLAFRTRNDGPDLGGRDRVHFIWRCR
jgi:hypothetical protein